MRQKCKDVSLLNSICMFECVCASGSEGACQSKCPYVPWLCAILNSSYNCPPGLVSHFVYSNIQATTSPTRVIGYHYALRRLQSCCWCCTESAASDKIFPTGTWDILTHLTCRCLTTAVSHFLFKPTPIETSHLQKCPPTFIFSHFPLSFVRVFYFYVPFSLHSLHHTEGEKVLNTASN